MPLKNKNQTTFIFALYWWLMMSKAIGRTKTHFSSFLPYHGSDLALLFSLLSSHWRQITPVSRFVPHHPNHFFFSATRFPFTLATSFPHCLYVNFTVTKKQGPQSWLEVIWRRGTDPRGEQAQGAVSSHVLYEKDVENTSHCPLWRDQASLLATYSRNCSQRSQRNILYHIGAKLASNVGVS